MRAALRYVVTVVLGLAVGLFAAVHTVRAGAFASNIAIGPWRTGRDFGTADANARTRAVVALSGLLALPAREARYYTASTDDAGRPLEGRCTYRIAGGTLPAQWWSLTLYDQDGYLAGPGPYSVESAAMGASGPWRIAVGPRATGGRTLPTANLANFQLTLRLYLPADAGRGDAPRSVLPSITREAC